MPRFRIRGRTITIDIDPERVSRRHRKLQNLREQLIEQSGGDVARVDRFLAQRITDGMERFSNAYLIDVSGRIDRIARVRDEMADVFDSVLRGEQVRGDAVQRIERMFRDLEAELGGLKSPSEYLAGLESIELPPAAASHRAATPDVIRATVAGEALGRQVSDLRSLETSAQQALLRAADLAPDSVRRATLAENSSSLDSSLVDLGDTLRRAGTSDADIARVETGLRELNERRRAAAATSPEAQARTAQALRTIAEPAPLNRAAGQRIDEIRVREQRARARGNIRYADALRRLRFRLDGWTRAGATQLSARLRDEVDASTYLSNLAAGGGIDMLRRLWVDYDSRRAVLRAPDFETYVRRRMSLFRGQRGETEVAFRGDRFSFLKPPDEFVTLRGTDLVAIDQVTGEILLIDNKAFSESMVTEVSALTRNIVRNLRDDVSTFHRDFGNRPDVPIELSAGAARLERALRDIDAFLSTTTDPIESDSVQIEIGRILATHNVRRVVTGAGGDVQRVSADLQKVGVQFMDLDNQADLLVIEPE